jgi:hypothetical protein
VATQHDSSYYNTLVLLASTAKLAFAVRVTIRASTMRTSTSQLSNTHQSRTHYSAANDTRSYHRYAILKQVRYTETVISSVMYS